MLTNDNKIVTVGSSAVVYHMDQPIEAMLSFSSNATSNQAEMNGLKMALDYIANNDIVIGKKVFIISDSAYCLNSITNYIYTWRSNGWRSIEGAEVKNKERWEDLFNSLTKAKGRGVSIGFIKVKGHNGVEGNEMADLIARTACLLNFPQGSEEACMKRVPKRFHNQRISIEATMQPYLGYHIVKL